MKAISIRQPWVHCIFHCGKDIENRSQKKSYRGQIVIHASSTLYKGEGLPTDEDLPRDKDLPRSCLIGTVDIVDCVEHSTSKWFMGKYGLVLANPKLFKTPIPFNKGQLQIFELPELIVKKNHEQNMEKGGIKT